jgi:hypothetical protein
MAGFLKRVAGFARKCKWDCLFFFFDKRLKKKWREELSGFNSFKYAYNNFH